MKQLLRVLLLCSLVLLASTPSSQRASALMLPVSESLVWIEAPAMPTARYNVGAAVSPQGEIYVVGGDSYTCVPLTTLEVFSLKQRGWVTLTGMPTGRWSLGAAIGVDGKLYAIGGRGGDCGADLLGTVEAYDPATGSWAPRAAMPTPRWQVGVAAGANGKLYAIGGEDASGSALNVVEEYDPLTDTWTRKGNMPAPNRLFATVAASNGKIYTIGGYGVSNRVWEFDPVADTWTEKAPMPTSRDGLGAAQVLNGRVYAAGGFGPGAVRLATVEVYDPAADTWATETSLSSHRTGPAVVAVRDAIVVLGGWGVRPDGSEGATARVEAAWSR